LEINNNKINTIIKPDIEFRSLYANENLHNILGDIGENIIDNSLMIFNFDKNKIDNKDRTEKIKQVIKIFKNINDVDKEDVEIKNYLMNLYQKIDNLESIFDQENYSNTNTEYVNNSEIVY